MSERTRCMLDIETLGTEPGAVVVSVGAVRFSREGIGETFYRSVDIQSCESAGLSIDGETLEWWWDQDEAVRDELSGGDDLRTVLLAFAEWVDGCDQVWAKSPAFDCVLLGAAYDAVGFDIPWEFWETRDVRTALDLVDVDTLPDDGVDHHALDDARAQARNVAAALKEVSSDE